MIALAQTAPLTEQRMIIGLAGIVVLGVCAQWLAWRIKLPAILLLLAAGITIGPVWQLNAGHKLLDPDEIFGSLLPALISLSVAVVLFEGGLTLNLHDLRHSGQVLWRLVSFGMACNGLAIAVAAHFLLLLPWSLAILLGAILVVTGPTVISPMLRFIRPTGQVGSILKWEGIVIDPVGATLALLVFEAVAAPHAPGGRAVAQLIAVNLLRTVGWGGAMGVGSAGLLIFLLRRFLIADQLQVPATLMFVIVSFVGANLLQDEAGLFAVTVMGVVLSNQRFVPIGHILEFKENLTVLLIGSLFVLLGSRLDAAQVTAVGWRALLFVAALILVARPLSALVSTLGTRLPWRQRLFLAWMAPRGIVAASVASVFALRLAGGSEDAAAVSQLVPITFAVVVATVMTYGLSSAWLARRVGISRPGHRGLLIVGANHVSRAIAKALKDAGQEALLVDTNREHVSAARLSGLQAYQGNVLSEDLLRQIEGTSIGRLLALTPNIDANALAMLHFGRHFGRSQVYALPHGTPENSPGQRRKLDISHELYGRRLFDRSLPFEEFWDQLDGGSKIHRTQLTREFDYAAMLSRHAVPPIILFVINELGELIVRTTTDEERPRPGQTVIALVAPPPKKPSAF